MRYYQVVELQVRPIDQWPRPFTKNRQRSKFSSSYGSTMQLLDRELKHLGARGVCLLMALRTEDIRLDGRPRSGARPEHPGIILCFEDKSGPKRFPCDKFDNWQDNLRAIALSLESLRTVDRYGVTTHGEQYRGWAALPSPKGQMGRNEAIELIRQLTGAEFNGTPSATLISLAERRTHPDMAGGNAETFKKVQEARRVLLGA